MNIGGKRMKAVVVMTFDPHKERYDVGVSLSYSLDLWYYRQKGIEIKKMTRDFPLYFAFFIKNCVEQRFIQDPKRTWLDHDVYSLFDQWISAEIEKLDAKFKGILLQLWNRSLRETCPIINEQYPIQDIQGDATKILSYIEGRRWLFEHLEKRLKMIDLPLEGIKISAQNSRNYLYALLQYLYLQEEIELSSGISLQMHNGKLEVCCERCGSINYGIHSHYCSICGQDDLVCDTCYVMGVSKGCSLVISRPKKDRKHSDTSINEDSGAYKYCSTDWIDQL